MTQNTANVNFAFSWHQLYELCQLKRGVPKRD